MLATLEMSLHKTCWTHPYGMESSRSESIVLINIAVEKMEWFDQESVIPENC